MDVQPVRYSVYLYVSVFVYVYAWVFVARGQIASMTQLQLFSFSAAL